MLMLTWPTAGGVTSVRNDDASWTRAVRVNGTRTGANACRASAAPRYVSANRAARRKPSWAARAAVCLRC